mgnify:CR=1 FL=1
MSITVHIAIVNTKIIHPVFKGATYYDLLLELQPETIRK